MEDLDFMTLDKFKLWSENALKVFLSCRKRSTEGNFDELSARAFCAWEENLPVDDSAERAERQLLDEYRKKLSTQGDVVPDPFSLDSGWEGEDTGMRLWPSVYVTDISAYLNCSTPNDVIHRLLNEYKEGKAYRYFDNGWVKEVRYHAINPKSTHCFLQAQVTPSQSVNKKNYDVWVLAKKDSDSMPGGEIVSAYCSCTAGMLGVCNHITGVLFRVEHAVKTGLTKMSVTDRKCQWNVPNKTTAIKPGKVRDFVWTKSNYSKSRKDKAEEKSKQAKKYAFTPLSKGQVEATKDCTSMRATILSLVKEDVPNSCFVLNMEKRRIASKKTVVKPSLCTLAADVKAKYEEYDQQLAEFKNHLKISELEVNTLKEATVQQSASTEWKEQRKGRLTASNFQRICSRVKTLKANPATDPSKLVETIMGSNSSSKQTLAMKHGLSLEPHAKKAFCGHMRKTHKKFKGVDSGLCVYGDNPCLAASADLETQCLCCGAGLCEIKCPETIKDQKPTPENLQYITMVNGEPTLDRHHPYFYQVQGQMGILNRSFCDLFIFTHHGHLCVRIAFDEQFWMGMKSDLVWFWETHVLPRLLQDARSPVNIVNDNKSPKCVVKTNDNPPAPLAKKSLQNLLNVPPKPKAKRRKINTQRKQPLFLCGKCGCDCIDSPKKEGDQSVACDKCGVWTHYSCASVNNDLLACMDEWFCTKCT